MYIDYCLDYCLDYNTHDWTAGVDADLDCYKDGFLSLPVKFSCTLERTIVIKSSLLRLRQITVDPEYWWNLDTLLLKLSVLETGTWEEFELAKAQSDAAREAANDNDEEEL